MRIFVSSTYKDLVAHRQIVENSLNISNIDYNMMEHFGATPEPPIQTCLDAVRESNVFIGVLGVRYGASPPRMLRSYTESEFRLARSLRIPIFMFLIDDRNASVSPASIKGETPEQQKRLSELKKFVLRHYTVTFFTTPEDLARLLLASLINKYGAWI